MNLRGNKNTSNVSPKKKPRKPRKTKSPKNNSSKLKTLVEQFSNITSNLTFRNELNESNKDDSKNISMKQDNSSDFNLHLTNNSFEMMHTSDLEKSILPLSSQDPAPLINSTQITKSQFPSLREPAFIGQTDKRGRKAYTWIRNFESLIDLDTHLRSENSANIITTHNTNVNCSQCDKHKNGDKHKMVQMYRKCKCNKPGCTLTFKINNCEFSKIWNLSVFGSHPVSSPIKDSSRDVRSPGKKSHKRYGVALRVQSIYNKWLDKDHNLTAQQLLNRLIQRRKEETKKFNKNKKQKKNDINMKYVFNKELLPSLSQVLIFFY